MLGRRAAAVVIAGWALFPLEARACSVCIGWTGGADADWGYYWSALLLTLLPFVVVAVIGAWLRRAASEKAAVRDGGNGLEPAVNAELAEDVLDVVPDRGRADVEPLGHGLGVRPARHEPENLDLPAR